MKSNYSRELVIYNNHLVKNVNQMKDFVFVYRDFLLVKSEVHSSECTTNEQCLKNEDSMHTELLSPSKIQEKDPIEYIIID